MKRQARKSYRSYKRNNTDETLQKYLRDKERFNKVKKLKKREYIEHQKTIINNLANPQEFWKLCKRLSAKRRIINPIDIQLWEIHLKEKLGTRITHNLLYIEPLRPYLEENISKQELKLAIKHLKNNKAPGTDMIPNEILKNLPEIWITYLLNMLNKFLEEEYLPIALTRVELTLLHKKGNKEDPNNYRGIALICTITKLLTQILSQRLLTWAESFAILPEAQAE